MHNVTERDGLFTVREPAWHGLGVVLPDYPTRTQAQQIAHPWEPVSEPVYRKVPKIITVPAPLGGELMEVLTEEYEEIPDQVLNVRSDTAAPLGVVSKEWEPVSNAEMYDIAEAIEGEDPGSVLYETGGSLLGGRKVWLLLRLRDPLVVKGDPRGETIPYYALQNAHDGSGSFRGQATVTRIVCDNTSQIADHDAQARGTEFVFRHTRNIHERIEEAKAALAGWRVSINHWRRAMDHLIEVPVNAEQTSIFIEEFVPLPPPHVISPRVMANVAKARAQLRTILEGDTCEGIRGTAYGLVQASIEYLEHYRRARSNETRFRRAYLDRSTLVADAHQLALEVAL